MRRLEQTDEADLPPVPRITEDDVTWQDKEPEKFDQMAQEGAEQESEKASPTFTGSDAEALRKIVDLLEKLPAEIASALGA